MGAPLLTPETERKRKRERRKRGIEETGRAPSDIVTRKKGRE